MCLHVSISEMDFYLLIFGTASRLKKIMNFKRPHYHFDPMISRAHSLVQRFLRSIAKWLNLTKFWDQALTCLMGDVLFKSEIRGLASQYT